MGRLEVETYEDGETVRYAYDNSGNLATVTDSATGVVTTYYYDLLNRQSGYREQGTNLDHSVIYTYDSENNLSTITEVINGTAKKYTYTYDEDNKLISETVGDVAANGSVLNEVAVAYTYDGFGRISNRVVSYEQLSVYSNPVIYSVGDGENSTSTQVASYNGFTYTYDDNGNILSVSDGTNTTSYQYDSQNQLIWEYNEAFEFAHHWEYDEAGNIRKRTEHDYFNGEISEAQTTFEYQYNYSQWRDLLTLCNNEDRLSDALGNLTDDEEWIYTWEHGRQLASMTKGNTTWTYTYDANGMRTKRTNGMDTYTYFYNGSQLVRLIVDTNELFDFSFTYDANGTPLTVTERGETYFYVTNLQGDVIGINNSHNQRIVSYEYDAWGKLLDRTNTQLADYNPLRYRGYVYDLETGLYYLQSRYYNPEWGRFINGDGLVATGQGFIGNNMFAYCGNNPLLHKDSSGFIIVLASGATKEQIAEYERAVAYLRTSKTGGNLITLLETASEVFTVSFIDDDNMYYNPNNRTIWFDTNSGLILGDGTSVQSAALGLAHEMGHAAQDLLGLDLSVKNQFKVEEDNLRVFENPIAQELGEPTRNNYLDTAGTMNMQNSTHYRTTYNRPWWMYLWPGNWRKPSKEIIDHFWELQGG